jgi:hypothetical protein
MADHLPTLCRACGAPAEPRGDVALLCPFCGTADELPRDAHDRVRELRRRLRARAAGVVQLTERDATLARIFESSQARRTILLPYACIGAVILAYQLTAYSEARASPGPYAIAMNLLGTLPLLAIPLAALIGLALGRRTYRRDIRDLLHAQPSPSPGGPARCRCCGAELPHEHGPLLRCRHCHTHSLVTPDLLTRSAATITRETHAHRQQLARAGARVTAIGRRMDRLLYLAIPAAYGVIIVLGSLIERTLLPR